MKKVLVVVDMQNDFVDGALGSEDAIAIVGNVVKEIEKDEYDLIYYTADTHYDDYLETYEGKNLPVKHCIKGTDGWKTQQDVYDALKAKGALGMSVEKPGFGSPELIEILRNEDMESVTLIGLCTDICVMTNAIMLRGNYPNLPIYYVEDCVAATSKENQEASFKIFSSCQIYPKKD